MRRTNGEEARLHAREAVLGRTAFRDQAELRASEHFWFANGVYGGVGTVQAGPRWPTTEGGAYSGFGAGVEAIKDGKVKLGWMNCIPRLKDEQRQLTMKLVTPLLHSCVGDSEMVSVAEDSCGSLICNRETLTLESETMIAMAGPASEYLHTNPDGSDLLAFRQFVTLHESLWITDRHDAEKHAASFAPDERNRFRERYWNCTLRMLRAHWNSVRAVASALLEKETLTDSQISDLIE